MEDVFFLVPPRAMCREFRNQGKNAPASPLESQTLLSSYWRRSYNYLLGDLELLLATKHYSLQHLVRAHVSFKVLHVPQLSDELSEPVLDNKILAMWVFLEQLTPHLVTSWRLISPGGLLISL